MTADFPGMVQPPKQNGGVKHLSYSWNVPAWELVIWCSLNIELRIGKLRVKKMNFMR
jgi:hypothetical protein